MDTIDDIRGAGRQSSQPTLSQTGQMLWHLCNSQLSAPAPRLSASLEFRQKENGGAFRHRRLPLKSEEIT
jgi:hypothetical protein